MCDNYRPCSPDRRAVMDCVTFLRQTSEFAHRNAIVFISADGSAVESTLSDTAAGLDSHFAHMADAGQSSDFFGVIQMMPSSRTALIPEDYLGRIAVDALRWLHGSVTEDYKRRRSEGVNYSKLMRMLDFVMPDVTYAQVHCVCETVCLHNQSLL